YKVILVNSNPATIMTDQEIADVVYIEPLTPDFLSRIIRKEQPDALLPTLGGQVGLNMAVELDRLGVLRENEVELLGTKLDSIKQEEYRNLFRKLMNDMSVTLPYTNITITLDEAYAFVEAVVYPFIVRPAITMCGTGGVIYYNEEDLKEIVANGLKYS